MTARKRQPCMMCGGPKPAGSGRRLCDHCGLRHRDNTGYSTPARQRASELRRRYGMTVWEYDALLERQGGLCAICRRPNPPNARITVLAVDHDHGTGQVRGLACQRCNMGLHFLENREWRESAEAYLASPPAGRCDEPILKAVGA